MPKFDPKSDPVQFANNIRWVVERSFAWMARFRRLARDYERLADTLKGFHWLAFAILLLPKVVEGLRMAS